MASASDVTHDDLLELARKTRQLIETIYAHPQMNNAYPERSPKMLWHTGDFLRRTFTDFIAPNLPPAQASLKPSIAFADPRCEDPRRGMPGAPPRSSNIIHGDAAAQWPALDQEKYFDARSRNAMSELIILEPANPMVKLMFPGVGESGFDFGEEIREMARGLNGKAEGSGRQEGGKKKKKRRRVRKGKKGGKKEEEAKEDEGVGAGDAGDGGGEGEWETSDSSPTLSNEPTRTKDHPI